MTVMFQSKASFWIDLKEPKRQLLHEKARSIDEENIGGELDSYSDEQAFQICWHEDPQWLIDNRIMVGWTYDKEGLW